VVNDHGRWAQAYGLSAGSVVDYLLGPVTSILGRGLAEASARMARALDATVDDWVRQRRSEDQYVVPGVHWDGFSHRTLFGMVFQQASPAQVETLADDWERNGRDLTQRAEDLQRSMAALLPYWGGEASEQAARSVIRAVGWMGDVGSTSSAMAGPLQDSAGALRSAQATMPAPPDGGGWLGAAGAGAAAGFAVGGPIGAGIGAAIGGIGSAFGFGSNKKKLKRRAVQTMQRYEAAAVQVDSTTPQFVDSGVGRIGQAEYDARRIGAQVPGAGTGPVPPPAVIADPTTPAGTRPSGVVPSVPGFGGGGSGPGGVGWRDLTGRGGAHGFLGGAGAFGAAGMGAPFAGRGLGGAGLGGAGVGGRGGAFGPGGRYGSAYAGRGGVFGDDGVARRAGGAGAAGGSPLMPGAGGRGDDDSERRRRYPYEEEPFKLDDEVAPPVIGG
jgi:hypothetical protein